MYPKAKRVWCVCVCMCARACARARVCVHNHARTNVKHGAFGPALMSAVRPNTEIVTFSILIKIWSWLDARKDGQSRNVTIDFGLLSADEPFAIDARNSVRIIVRYVFQWGTVQRIKNTTTRNLTLRNLMLQQQYWRRSAYGSSSLLCQRVYLMQ